jgi:7,8-dihydroneopterin aldolase/epimerase/oxygenase
MNQKNKVFYQIKTLIFSVLIIFAKNYTMGLIALEGMRFHAYHGFYDEEQIIGNDYIVDVYITANTGMAAATDDLYQTINYETVYEVCKFVMREKTRLLETIIERITIGLKHQFSNIQAVQVRIKKVNPPLGGHVDFSIVENEESFMNQCGRCNRAMICYGDHHCKCKEIKVHPRTQEGILQQYRRCLCPSCLKFFAN